MKLGEQ